MNHTIRNVIIVLLFVALGIAIWWGANWYIAGHKDILRLSKEGDIKELQYVLHWRPDRINYRDVAGGTPLIYAIYNGHIEVIEMLIDKGADIELRTSETHSPLYIAVEKENIEIIKVLLNAGADVNAITNYGWTPLNVARNHKNDTIIDLLLLHGGKTGWELISPLEKNNE